MGRPATLVATVSPALALGQLKPRGCGSTRPGRAVAWSSWTMRKAEHRA
jgi:hypothetical protein